MRVIGLTGGIASGKSTVSAMLRGLGAQVIDADEVAREVVEKGRPALAEIGRRFPDAIDSDGTLNRERLGTRVFENSGDRLSLNQILHPAIQQAVFEKTTRLEALGVTLLFYDAALLIENGLESSVDGILLVVVPRALQLLRLLHRDGLTPEAAEARVASQLPLEEKVKHARWLVDNSGSLAETRAQVVALWDSLHTVASGKVHPS